MGISLPPVTRGLSALLKPLRRLSGVNRTVEDQISARVHGPYGATSGYGQAAGLETQERVDAEELAVLDAGAADAGENEGMKDHSPERPALLPGG